MCGRVQGMPAEGLERQLSVIVNDERGVSLQDSIGPNGAPTDPAAKRRVR
jgi:hypothetical protein